MNIGEQIAAFEAKRAATQARMAELIEIAAQDGATLDAAQQEEFDTLELDLKAIDDHLRRLHVMQTQQAATAKPVTEANNPERAGKVRTVEQPERTPVVKVTPNVEKGVAFARYVMAFARSQGNRLEAAEYAKTWHDSTPEVEIALRAAVAPGNTTDPTWAGPLVEYTHLANEFIDLLRPATILGRIPGGFRRVPFNVSFPLQTTASSTQWVGEGLPKPVSALGFDTMKLGFAKVASIVVITEELLRFSNPNAETLVRDDMIEVIARFLDLSFIDPSRDAVAGVSPASVTFGAPSIAASGSGIVNLRYDIQRLFGLFSNANMSLAGAVWLMNPLQSLAISMFQNPLGQAEFAGVTGLDGGTLMGLPVITSNTIPEGEIILLLPREIFMADDGGVTIDMSREASLQMSTAPSPGAAQLVSLWQQNLVGLRAERWINWARRRGQAVAMLTGANYGDVPEGASGGGDGGGGEGFAAKTPTASKRGSSSGAAATA